MGGTPASPPSGNRLLDLLPPDRRSELGSRMERIPTAAREVMVPAGRPMRSVYFPLSGVISLVVPLSDGSIVEAASIGREGMVGVRSVLGSDAVDTTEVVSQIPGKTLVMDIDAFRSELTRDRSLDTLVRAYSRALFAQLSQNIACTAAHDTRQRVARWLLEAHDRVDGDRVELTHEFLAAMLRVTRPSVSVAARTLQETGLIAYRRGEIAILDRAGLERAACECYRAVRDEYARLLAT